MCPVHNNSRMVLLSIARVLVKQQHRTIPTPNGSTSTLTLLSVVWMGLWFVLLFVR